MSIYIKKNMGGGDLKKLYDSFTIHYHNTNQYNNTIRKEYKIIGKNNNELKQYFSREKEIVIEGNDFLYPDVYLKRFITPGYNSGSGIGDENIIIYNKSFQDYPDVWFDSLDMGTNILIDKYYLYFKFKKTNVESLFRFYFRNNYGKIIPSFNEQEGKILCFLRDELNADPYINEFYSVNEFWGFKFILCEFNVPGLSYNFTLIAPYFGTAGGLRVIAFYDSLQLPNSRWGDVQNEKNLLQLDYLKELYTTNQLNQGILLQNFKISFLRSYPDVFTPPP